ncbi:hypothetical protein GCM10010324_35990 [Streptomyces hiroshimensis]|uniref:Uncharacterized protein n=1 Tax=Streptomyces hiroshimensis TaxID=66424 RepID=A0ABQ2YKE7_9ACTN|nr:hypothetical protein GCM10010324_35990 [Streptomyces hiroshimensis]
MTSRGGDLGIDQIELVAGAVGQYDLWPQVTGVAGFGLVEGVDDDLSGRADQGGGAPLDPGLGPYELVNLLVRRGISSPFQNDDAA